LFFAIVKAGAVTLQRPEPEQETNGFSSATMEVDQDPRWVHLTKAVEAKESHAIVSLNQFLRELRNVMKNRSTYDVPYLLVVFS
jgi:hypothetical protein